MVINGYPLVSIYLEKGDIYNEAYIARRLAMANDVLIVGSGAAGMALAVALDELGLRVQLLSKAHTQSGSSWYAQGGMAAAISPGDSPEQHAQDSLKAAAGLGREDRVRHFCERAPDAVRWLQELGVPFNTANDGTLSLRLEAGHRHRRIVHIGDRTGDGISRALAARIAESNRIEVLENHAAIDLISQPGPHKGVSRCIGLHALNLLNDSVATLVAPMTVLATGGAGRTYLYSSNPMGASGDGLAMAWRAGCRLANLEFIQFHPTCLYHPAAGSMLLSETLRGEGAVLRLQNGERFMQNYHTDAELAPRDVVARAIDREMKRCGNDFVLLDISHQDDGFLQQTFPHLIAQCARFGYDLLHEPVPVVPAAHYCCGGVLTEVNGDTGKPGLYAIGETCYSGLHGANRLASNSLLECVVQGREAAVEIAGRLQPLTAAQPPDWDESRVQAPHEQVMVAHNWAEVRRLMWDYVGIVRSDERLRQARARLALLRQEIDDYYASYRVSGDLIELRNLVLVADLIAHSAQLRRESRGLHATLDYPGLAQEAVDTVLNPSQLQGPQG